MADRRSLFSRIAGFLDPRPVAVSIAGAEGKEAAVLAELAKGNGNGKHAKSVSGVTLSGFSFLPNGEGIANILQLDSAGLDLATAYAVSAYAYIAMRYRAERLGEPALMVVREDKIDGGEEWQPDHPLARLLEEPAPDYDMGELLYRTSLYIDMGGACLWVVDKDRAGRPGRITPYRQDEFTVESTADRIRGLFRVNTSKKQEKALAPEQVVHFIEPHPTDWLRGQPRLEVALAWLQLSERARVSVRDILKDAVWPSLVVQTDPAWKPGEKEFDLFKQELNSYGRTKGKPLALLGGGSATVVALQLKDLLPDSILNRVESVVAAVFQVPAIILQFQVGMENAPWSQMEEARRMHAEDSLDPRWRGIERILTRQLLRRADEDPTLFVRYDRSTIKGLQADRVEQAQLASLMARDASLNERRAMVGLEPVADPAADKIPALQPPPPNPFGAPPSPGGNGGEQDDDEGDDEEEPEDDAPPKNRRGLKARRRMLLGPSAIDSSRQAGLELTWQILADRQLQVDQDAIVGMARRILGGEAKGLDDEPSEKQRRRFLTAVAGYLKTTSRKAWGRQTQPLLRASATQEVAGVSASLGIRFDLVQPEVEAFVLKENQFLLDSLGETTAEIVQETLAAGVAEGKSVRAIAEDLQGSHAFGRDRSQLIARTEVGRAQNGAALESIKSYGERTGRSYVKVWDTAGDDRVRDEHAAIEGETVPIDQPFSNGLMHPSEPNCRCRARFLEIQT